MGWVIPRAIDLILNELTSIVQHQQRRLRAAEAILRCQLSTYPAQIDTHCCAIAFHSIVLLACEKIA
eukprot:CAMPEP_0115540074 /NCGR_PEP_ID=MMETSP0271-20121206/89739_1 /TAXON_ID=71861 /ORGANISM="Scrippsiella trochoidea, Strain CCMP3099" /LENGTH=66 /DNA_ID=CAMNT_0002973055 /DNA_START=415 /DNA_END=615 /DNA_ORIENTATION=+